MRARDRVAVVALGVAVATSGFVPCARAQTPPPDPPSASSEHETALKSGLEHYAKGNYVTAIATWESLLATIGEQRGFKVLYNLGLAYQQIGDVTHAIERYRAFIKQVSEKPYADADLTGRADDARQRVKELEATHGSVLVKPPARGGVVLTRVGTAEPRAAGYVVYLAPGTHTVEVFVGTARAKEVRIEVTRGEQVEVDTTPPEEPAPPPPPAPIAPASSGWSPRTTWLVAGSAVTAVSFALPLGLLAVANGKKSDAEALGEGHSGYAAAKSSYDSAKTAYGVSYALPAALGVTTLIVWLAWKNDHGTESEPTTTAAVGPNGVLVQGRF